VYLTVEAFHGECPVCTRVLDQVPVTSVNCANTAQALQALAGFGHLVVLAGKTWLVKCASDQHKRLMPAKLVPVVLGAAAVPAPASASARRR